MNRAIVILLIFITSCCSPVKVGNTVFADVVGETLKCAIKFNTPTSNFSGIVIAHVPNEKKMKYAVLTCAHVLSNVNVNDLVDVRAYQSISANEPPRYLSDKAVVIKVDTQLDLMVLMIESDYLDVGVVKFAARSEWGQFKIGQQVFMMGAAMDEDIVPTFGHIMAVKYWQGYRESFGSPWTLFPQSFFKTSISTVPGNSGSGIFNEFGLCLGMVHAVYIHGPIIFFHINISSRSDFILEWLLK
jgi:S1-C subfamily serine protease